MAFDKALADRVREIALRREGCSERAMFGGLALFLGGHMCCGVINTDLMLRLAPADVTAALREPHTRPMDFTGRTMKSMLYVEASGLDTEQAISRWVEAAMSYARRLPPKDTRSKAVKRVAAKSTRRRGA